MGRGPASAALKRLFAVLGVHRVRWSFGAPMSLLRLAYVTQFLIAVIAVYTLWSQVGGQSHLDYMAWPLKLALGAGAAFCAVKATAASVGGEHAWNGRTLRWLGLLLVLLVCCGLASYYVHLYVEPEDDDQQDDNSAMLALPSRAARTLPMAWAAAGGTTGAADRNQ